MRGLLSASDMPGPQRGDAMICPLLAIAMALGNPIFGESCAEAACAMWQHDHCGLIRNYISQQEVVVTSR